MTHIALVGLSGTGKTTVGRALAAQLERPFVDTVAVTEARMGCTIAWAFEQYGEPWSWAHERAACAACLAHDAPSVIAVAAGAIQHDSVRAGLAARAFVVWLTVPVWTLVARLDGCTDRPLFHTGNLEATLNEMKVARGRWYQQVANLYLEASDPPDVVARHIARAVAGAGVGV